MGIERARVVEVCATGTTDVRAGSGYQLDDRLVLTSAELVGRSGSAHVRPAGTGTWVPSTVVWRGDAVVLDVSDPSALMTSPRPLRLGDVAGGRPVAVTGMGFPLAAGRSQWARDPEQFVAQLSADGSVDGRPPPMTGAALFAGAELVGILADERRAVAVAALAADPSFDALVGRLPLVRVETPPTGLPILRFR